MLVRSGTFSIKLGNNHALVLNDGTNHLTITDPRIGESKWCHVTLRADVANIQTERFSSLKLPSSSGGAGGRSRIHCNAQMTPALMRQYATPAAQDMAMLREVINFFNGIPDTLHPTVIDTRAEFFAHQNDMSQDFADVKVSYTKMKHVACTNFVYYVRASKTSNPWLSGL